MPTGPKPLRTKYRDHLFRSRLEARWAVFFDVLGIRWEYEPEGFELSDGSCYLPDFWLPATFDGVFAEVKPEGGDYSKARRFAAESRRPLWMCEGSPSLKPTHLALPSGGNDRLAMPTRDLAAHVEAVRFATGYSFWEPGGGTPTRLREVVARRSWR